MPRASDTHRAQYISRTDDIDVPKPLAAPTRRQRTSKLPSSEMINHVVGTKRQTLEILATRHITLDNVHVPQIELVGRWNEIEIDNFRAARGQKPRQRRSNEAAPPGDDVTHPLSCAPRNNKNSNTYDNDSGETRWSDVLCKVKIANYGSYYVPYR